MELPQPLFAPGTKVRYKPYHRPLKDGGEKRGEYAWPTEWDPEPWRVKAVKLDVHEDYGTTIEYVVVPWESAHQDWFLVRPMRIDADRLTLWSEGSCDTARAITLPIGTEDDGNAE